jgi:hypothetical protein
MWGFLEPSGSKGRGWVLSIGGEHLPKASFWVCSQHEQSQPLIKARGKAKSMAPKIMVLLYNSMAP